MDRDLVISALHYRRCALFELLDDSQIFAVTLPDGCIGYCCCMGNGGEHYSLALYRDTAGFATPLDTIDMDYDASLLDRFEQQMTFHAVNCDFENAADCVAGKEKRAFIKQVAAEEGIKMCRSKGWPDFNVMDGSTLYKGIPDENLRRDMTLALDAGCEVARKVRDLDMDQLDALGFVPDYAPACGGKTIPLLSRQQDGSWTWNSMVTPARPDNKCVDYTYGNSALASRVAAMEHAGTFECRVLHSPMPVVKGDLMYYPLTVLTVFKSAGITPFMPEFVREEDGCMEAVLDNFANGIINLGRCPAVIEVEDEMTYHMLRDFCDKTGIKLRRADCIPHLEKLWNFLRSMMR